MRSYYRRRALPAPPRPAPEPNSAAAWCALLQRAGGSRVEAVEIPDGADDKAVLRAWRDAAVRVSGEFREA